MIVQHHVKYKEIHGKDEIIMMDYDKHVALHKKLRAEGKCKVPPDELHKIAQRAHFRTELYKKQRAKYNKENIRRINHYTNLCVNIFLAERITFNSNNGNISYTSWFTNTSRSDLIFIDI